MSVEQKRQQLRAQLDGLKSPQLDKVSQFIHEMLAAESSAIKMSAAIRDLPRIITDYPILVWGWDPCDSNAICEVWFGPLTAPVINVRKNYPQHRRLDRYETLAMLVATSDGYEYTFASEQPSGWVNGVQASGKDLAELGTWAMGEGRWPSVYNPADKRAQPADLKRVYAEAEHFIESLDENICDTAAEELKCIVEHIQNELHRRGTNLSSDYAEVGFSFNRENGTIDYLDGRKFIPLIDRTITPAPDGILIAEGVSLTGRDLSGAQLKGMILNELELGGVVLSDANLQGAQLLYTILSGADLSNADLSGANLTYADLQGAKLTGANLSEANLDNAVLTGVVFDETTRWPADFQVPGSS